MAKSTTSRFTALALAINGLIVLAASGQPTNLLNNPGFEINSPGQDTNVVQWQLYGANTFVETSPLGSSLAHGGTNYFKVSSATNGTVNYDGCYQDYISGPGATYSADGWMYTASSDTIAGQNQAWIEVTFRDPSANMLALYRTALLNTNLIASGTFPKNQWNHLQITNQYDINSFQVTNTVTQLVAPPGTAFVRYQIVFQGDAANSHGSAYFDDMNILRTSSAPYGNMNIVWDDEFNGSNINPNVWTYDLGNGGSNPGWGNNELEYYTSRTNNAYVANGLLHIVARQESTNGFSFTSARMKTEGLFSFTYGRIEWRAQLPYGMGFWPALWMLGTNINSVGWPTCGEIDVVENTGTNTTMVQSSIHYGGDGTAIYNFTNHTAVTNFHTYTLDWTTNALLFYVDGHLFESQTGWGNGGGPYPFPFNQPFFLIMNLAVGGNYVQNPSVSTIETQTTFPGEILVDYVRIYRTTDPLQISITQTPSNILLSWPSNIICNLQGQTNSTSGIGTNWYPISTTTNQLQLLPVVGSAFYRLTSP
ncbi:MAG TPA: glycoside hydrolase family 16 protein [Verrucomicrobiae bacterium]|nr:glycoside hydrolase family 16 protein [Verrucomicrobiae bacterium]